MDDRPDHLDKPLTPYPLCHATDEGIGAWRALSPPGGIREGQGGAASPRVREGLERGAPSRSWCK